MNRFEDVCREAFEDSLTEDMILNYAFRRMLRRMRDKEFDKYDRERCTGKTEDEIKQILIKDIVDGQLP